jgi:ABC-type multidrug transport system fused ATPase/permease subunit
METTPRTTKLLFTRCISVFSKRDQKRIIAVVILQTGLGALDLIGVLLIGLIGALAVTGIQSSEPGNRVGAVLNVLQLSGYSFQLQTAILGIAATLVLVGRTVLSVVFTRKILFFISRRSAVISGDLIRRVLQQNSLKVSSMTVQETIYSITNGVVAVTLGVVGTAVTIIADVSLLFVMAIGLLAVDPIIAISTFLLFAAVGVILYKLMHGNAIKLGKQDAQLNIRSNEKISEVLTSYREATVRNRRDYYANEIGKARLELSDVLAELNFMPTISKYVIEGTMILGAVSIAAIQFSLQDSKHAVATLAVFLGAGTRIAPAILRVQQGAISIKSSMGAARPTLELIDTLPISEISYLVSSFRDSHGDFKAEVCLNNVSFTYPGKSTLALSNLDLKIPQGETCAIVGPSGSGKTTLVDLILGMFDPTLGKIEVSGQAPLLSIKDYPGAIGYVPQDVALMHGSIRENVALGFPISDASDERILQALEIAQLADYVKELPEGIDTQVGPRGSRLSGGQRQRLGIARAMFTKPRLLILDESTSALDAQTELLVTEAISSIPYEITIIIIAHRLSTVRFADQVVYLEAGKMITKGSFDEVRTIVPDFNLQAKLMGL